MAAPPKALFQPYEGFVAKYRWKIDEQALHQGCCVLQDAPFVAVGMRITAHPPHRTRRAAFPHRAPTSGGWRQSGDLAKDG
jgi:hypothetical protein